MKSFFRSAADISSSRGEDDTTSRDDSTDRSDDSEYKIARIRTLGSNNSGDVSESGAHETFAEGSRKSSYHRDLLLHALLEERCINEAHDDLTASGWKLDKNHPQVRALAKEKYLNLCQKLGNYGLVKGELDTDQLGGLRETYRNGLSLLTRTPANTSPPPIGEMLDHANVPGSLLHLFQGNPAASNMTSQFDDMHLSGQATLGSILPGHPLLHSTRYARDFEEFGMLGKGGYGTVFRVKHNLDGRHYAVKKIPLGPSRMRRIQENGQAELDHILVEVRTLARLEHPNIVRYHSGWIEWAPLMIPAKQVIEFNRRKLLEAPKEGDESDAVEGSAEDPSIDVQFGYDDDDDDDDPDVSFGDFPGQRYATQEEEHSLFEDSSMLNDRTASDAPSIDVQFGYDDDEGPEMSSGNTSRAGDATQEEESSVFEGTSMFSYQTAHEEPSSDIQFEYDEDEEPDMSFNNASRQREQTQDEEQSIFEDTSALSDNTALNTALETQSLTPNSYSDGATLQKLPSHSTVSDGSNVELITRYDDPTSSYSTSDLSNSQACQPSEPSLALHIQMSLYSMTLSDFLSPTPSPNPNNNNNNNNNNNDTTETSSIASLRHCFHPFTSLQILSSIIEGVEYLHSEGIVHRDLKPGNIFLGIRPGSKCPPGAIPLSSCPDCMQSNIPRPFNITICIGDFGLVSAIARPEDDATEQVGKNKAVGTEIYRPERVTRDNHPSLDVFALGVVAVELVCRFGTRMERIEMLSKLKKGRVPEGLDGQSGCEGLGEWIRGMVVACEAECPSWDDVRRPLEEMLRKCG